MTNSRSDAEDAIRTLTAEYSFIVDKTHKFDELAKLWVEDGIFDASDVGLPPFNGRDAIRDGFAEMDKQIEASFHIVGNHLIEVDGDEATGTCWYYGRGKMADGEPRDSCGYYDDRYTATADGWRFRSRTLHLLVPIEYEMDI
jgi:ketosteroid isomerase-like protein